MRWLILLVVIFSLSNLLSAQDFAKSFNRYESEKKQMATGYLWSTIIPGGGFFYSGREGTGCLFLAGEIVFYSIAKESIKNKDDAVTFYILAAIIKGAEFIFLTDAINEENRFLRERLNLAIDFQNNYQGLKLSYTF